MSERAEMQRNAMKPIDKAAIPITIASAVLMIGIFHKPLGLPDVIEMPLVGLAGVLMGVGFYFAKQAKTPSHLPPPLPDAQKKVWILMLASVAAACIAGPFILPLIGPELPFQVRVMICTGTFVLCSAMILIGMKMKRR